jgi:hypothetical protein
VWSFQGTVGLAASSAWGPGPWDLYASSHPGLGRLPAQSCFLLLALKWRNWAWRRPSGHKLGCSATLARPVQGPELAMHCRTAMRTFMWLCNHSMAKEHHQSKCWIFKVHHISFYFEKEIFLRCLYRSPQLSLVC